MSGEESLAQVNREIEHPKLKNLEKAGLVIFLYSLLFTSLVSFFAVMIIPDKVRPRLFRQPDQRTGHARGGPVLAATGLPGLRGGGRRADSVGCREHVDHRRQWSAQPAGRGRRADPWFKKPHSKFGTSYRVINLIAGLQLLTIVASRGNVYLLASLYAFGVIWSFSFMSLAVLVFRYKRRKTASGRSPATSRSGEWRYRSAWR